MYPLHWAGLLLPRSASAPVSRHNVPFDVSPPVGLGVTSAVAEHLDVETAGLLDDDFINPENVNPQIVNQQHALLKVYESKMNRKHAAAVNQVDMTMSDRKHVAASNRLINLLDDVIFVSAGE